MEHGFPQHILIPINIVLYDTLNLSFLVIFNGD